MQEKQPPEKIRRIPTFQEELPPTHKVNTDGADVAVDVGVISEPEEEAGLADGGVADQEKLEQVVTANQIKGETSAAH
jgi:hypothetical protein